MTITFLLLAIAAGLAAHALQPEPAEAQDKAQFSLSWTAPGDGGSDITSYDYSTDGGTTWRTTIPYVVTQTSAATPASLVNGTEYTFAVRAVNAEGNGPSSSTVKAAPQGQATAPGQVTGLEGVSGDARVMLSWDAPSNGGSDILRYEYTTDDGTTWASTGSTTTEYEVTQTSAATPVNLVNGTAYTFRVRAVNDVGNGAQSDLVTATPANQPPAFSGAATTRNVAENRAIGTNVGAPVTASDPEGDTVTYSITGANPAGFTVTGSGQVQTGQVLDREAEDSYTITLQASATGGSDTITVTINVNEAPSFPSSTATREIEENRLAGTSVGDPVTATDADNDTLTYTLGGADAASFEIGGSSGQITVGPTTSLDHETKDTYMVTVTAADTFGATGSVAVTIRVLDIREVGVLGRIVITVGRQGDLYGYDSGSYGSLDSGSFPGALFDDGQDLTVSQVYENAAGEWFLTYTGGAANGWNSSQEEMDEVLVKVTYEDGRDRREFVLGGFIDSRPGTRGLKLAPPLPSRDWDGRNRQQMAIEFLRHTTELLPHAPGRIADPEPAAGSFIEFVNETTPGGVVVAQYLLVLLVYGGWMMKPKHSLQSFLMGGVIMALTPWVAAIFQIGTPMAATINTINIALGAYVYKYVFDKAEDIR